MQAFNSKFRLRMARVAALAAAACICQFDSAGAAAPGHVVRVNSLISAFGGRAAAAELMGYDATVDGARLTGLPLTYLEGSTLSFDLYWIPRETPAAGLAVVFRFSGSGPTLEQAYPIDTNAWQTGVVSRQRVGFRHPRGRYSGKAVLSVGLRARAEEKEYLLHTAPVFVKPSVFASKVDEDRLRQQFGEDLVPLNAAFRLGEGAEVTIALAPGEKSNKFRGVVIVSATGYDGLPVKNEAVCEVKVGGDCGQFEGAIRTGLTTGPNERMRYEQLGGNALEARPFSAGDRMDYAGVMEFDPPCRPEKIVFRYTKAKGIIDVKEVALLKAYE